MEQIEDANKNTKRLNSLTEFQRHWDKSRASRKHPNKCFVCGEDSYHKCEVCNVPLHGLNSRSKNAEHCFIDYHNDGFFGLARGDCALVNTLQRNWRQPTTATRKRNAAHVANLITPKPPAMLTRRAAAAARTFPAQLLPVPAPAAADDEPEVVIDWV